jgi:ribosomal protein S18 acetylase RimI-like enzyme
LSRQDYDSIAKLHIEGIPFGFLSSLGVSVLSAIYEAVDNHAGSILVVERDDNGKPAGFLAGTSSVKQFYRFALTRKIFNIAIPLSLELLSIKTIIRIAETLLYPFRKHNAGSQNTTTGANSPQCELLSIAVGAALRGRGTGKRLVARFEEFMIQNGIRGEYKVVTSAIDEQSNGFYKSAGFKLNHEFVHHGNRMNEYRKQIIAV